MLSMIRSGLGASARNTPGRPFRLLAARRSARLGLRPCAGGTDELSGVLGGPPSFASSSAMRRVSSSIRADCASICPACASTSAISSSVDSFASASRYILRSNHANIHLSSKIYALEASTPQNVPSPLIRGSAGAQRGSDGEGSDYEGVSSYRNSPMLPNPSIGSVSVHHRAHATALEIEIDVDGDDP